MAVIRADSRSGGLVGELKWMLTRPSVILYFVLGVTMRWWVGAAAYELLRTYFLAPGGLLAWLIALVVAGVFVYGVVAFFVKVAKTAPLVRAARAARLSAEPDRADLDVEAGRVERRRAIRSHLGLILLPTLLLVPCGVAITVGSGDMPRPTLVRDHGKLRFASKAEQIRLELHALKRRGLFTPLN